ncbi:L-threonylcarbamoyladenylate synthase [Oscillospiraceae bacterium 21-37]
METLFLKAHNTHDVERAGEILRAGGLVAIPTETVYGLAADALNGNAVKKIFAAKGRPSDNPLIVHISGFSQLAPLVKEVPEAAKRLAQAFWPGPLTIILEKSALVPMETSGGLDTVAVRMPRHPAARAVIEAAGVPLAAPSANLSGRPSPTSFAHVREDLAGRVDALLDGGPCDVGVESTVITLAGDVPRVLRPGGVTLAQLRAVLGQAELDPAVLHSLREGAKASSPGMKYKHYAPKAEVTLVDASPEEFAAYVNERKGGWALCFQEDLPFVEGPAISLGSRYDGGGQARRLFGALLELDKKGAQTAFAHCPSRSGVGLAVYNRLLRAAGFRVAHPEGTLVVGLAGPSGAGKSTVGDFLKQGGCSVLNCDSLTRSSQVYSPDCIEELRAAFGEDVAPGGKLYRKELARRAFATQEGRKRLGEITFPRILKQVRQVVESAREAGAPILVLDAPTLFESGLDSICARIVVVTAVREERLSRVMDRDNLSREQAEIRFSAQQDEDFYESRADYVIENSREPGRRLAAEAVLADLKGEAAKRL